MIFCASVLRMSFSCIYLDKTCEIGGELINLFMMLLVVRVMQSDFLKKQEIHIKFITLKHFI